MKTHSSIYQRLSAELDLNKTPRRLGTEVSGIDFASNDYLGLTRLPLREIKSSGSTGSRLLTGNHRYADLAEKKLASAFGFDKSLIYPAGYMANLGVLSCIPKKGDLILYDQHSHACIKDGARLSLAIHQGFKHNDLKDLERRLKKESNNKFIIVESIYSMDGDEAPLREIVSLAKENDANVIVDEAHATGVRGANGGGVSEELGIQDELLAVIHTFGKAVGGHGASVSAKPEIINYLINFSRPFIFTTGLPPASYTHLLNTVDLLKESSTHRIALSENIDWFNKYWTTNGPGELDKCVSRSAIQAIIFPGNDQVRNLASRINKDGLDVRPILHPTVPEGSERIRIIIHAFNTKNEIESLVQSFKKNVK